ncbi:thiamine phosphate synthase [Acidocella facilis]|uniref:thiamine phosphate synthase n=1 Tax=Acidocella facilis TaxID=525 RepID=UPI001F200864|nr:thiamine phosphate synthase [Acidocella facilis]
MDSRLIAWGRAVKRRDPQAQIPPLWFFTDAQRTPDPLAVIARLPLGLCGVVLRHDQDPDRARLARRVAKICRARRLALIIAGDARLAASLKAGLHLRGGAGRVRPHTGLRSASAHDEAQIRQARRAGVALVFISPVHPTASHPGARGLGAAGWRRLAARLTPVRGKAPIKPFALGGMNGRHARNLGPACAGVGAIDAFF